MITKARLLIIVTLAILLACNQVDAGQEAVRLQMNVDSPIRSEVVAALLVAYEEHSRWWKSKGVELTPHELQVRHWAVHYSQSTADRVRVVFLPESPTMTGGDIGYIVDLKSLRVVDRFFGR